MARSVQISEEAFQQTLKLREKFPEIIWLPPVWISMTIYRSASCFWLAWFSNWASWVRLVRNGLKTRSD